MALAGEQAKPQVAASRPSQPVPASQCAQQILLKGHTDTAPSSLLSPLQVQA